VNPSSILILRLSALGDVIHTLPAAEAIRRAFPSARIGWVVERPYAELVRLTAPVDEVFVASTKTWRRDPFGRETRKELFGLARSVREFVRDGITVDFQGLLKSAAFGPISRAPVRYGFAPPHVKENAAALFYSERIAIDPSRHVIEWNVGLVSGVAGRDIEVPDVRLDRLADDPAGRVRPVLEGDPVVLFPGAGRPEKTWPVERFGDLAKALREQTGRKCVVAWGPGEEAVAHEIAERGGATLAPPTDLRELAFLVSGASAFVAADTGPLHLSAALRTPTVGLSGPTDPRRNGPWKQVSDCVESYSSSRSMSTITVRDVVERLVSVLARNAA
jgi:lipopolysaccharide heptosyltransferase I